MLGSLSAGIVLSGQDPEKLVNNVTDDVIAEDPSVSCIANFDDGNKWWLELTELRVQFPLAHGTVIARIAPYEPNLHKVIEACVEIVPQPQLPESSSSKGESSLPNSSLFDSVKTQGIVDPSVKTTERVI